MSLCQLDTYTFISSFKKNPYYSVHSVMCIVQCTMCIVQCARCNCIVQCLIQTLYWNVFHFFITMPPLTLIKQPKYWHFRRHSYPWYHPRLFWLLKVEKKKWFHFLCIQLFVSMSPKTISTSQVFEEFLRKPRLYLKVVN